MQAYNSLRSPISDPRDRVERYGNLSNDDVALLTSILSHAPPPTVPESSHQRRSYIRVTQAQITQLPPHLHGPSYPVLSGFHRRNTFSGTPRLCRLHRSLNLNLVESIFDFVRKDLEDRIPEFVTSFGAGANVPTLMDALSDVPAMWMAPADYSAKYYKRPSPIWTRQEDCCVACMLARIGSSSSVLLALRTGMVARMSARKSGPDGNSVRFFWLRCWISRFGVGRAEEVMRTSQDAGMRLKELKKEIRNARNLARRADSRVPGSATRPRDPFASPLPIPRNPFADHQDTPASPRDPLATPDDYLSSTSNPQPQVSSSSVYSQSTGAAESEILNLYRHSYSQLNDHGLRPAAAEDYQELLNEGSTEQDDSDEEDSTRAEAGSVYEREIIPIFAPRSSFHRGQSVHVFLRAVSDGWVIESSGSEDASNATH